MNSTQRSRAIAALVALVAVLALGAVVSSVLTRPDGDTAATGTSVGTPSSVAAADGLQVNSANLRAPVAPSGVRVDGDGASEGAEGQQITATTGAKASATLPARRKKSSTTIVKPPVKLPPGSTASTMPTTVPVVPGVPAPPTTTKPASTVTVTSPPAVVSMPTSVATTKPTAVAPSSIVTSPTSIVTVPATTPTTRPTTTTAAPTTASTAAPTTTPPATGGLSGVEQEIARLTNELRTNPNGALARKKAQPSCVTLDGSGKVQPVPALAVSEGVSLQMSRPWSVDMDSRNTMSHRGNDSALAIYTQLGISPRTWGENVAWFQGYSDAQAAQVFFEGWRESDGHYCNMMSPAFTNIGVGVFKGAQRSWATQNFYAGR